MEIRVLKYFLAIIDEGSITKAADTLHITQPTLSRQIMNLEDELGAKLFERGTKSIKLTDEGLLLKRRAEEIIDLVEKTEDEIFDNENNISGTITIGSGELATFDIIPPLIDEFRKRYPHVKFDIITATADIVREQMDKGLIDIGILLEPINIEKYKYVKLKEKEKMVVLLSSNSLLVEKEYLEAKDLINTPLILPRRISVQSEITNWFGPYFDSLDFSFSCNLANNATKLVHNNIASAIVSEGAVTLYDKERIKVKPLKPDLLISSVIAWRKDIQQSKAVSKFIESLLCFLGMD